MADLQSSFRKFHDEIAYERASEGKILADKRRKILDRLAEGIKRQRTEGKVIPNYTELNQGSYAMGTGIKPIDGDFDLDVAILFDLDKATQADPVTVKSWVFDAVENHTKTVDMKGPCVTVQYVAQGEPTYHVDLAVYAAKNADGKTYLARGRLNSAAEFRTWQDSDPKALIDFVGSLHSNPEDAAQFRRVIRYLKRWRDVNFTSGGNAAPLGIALTACAIRWFRPQKKIVDSFRNTVAYDDLEATHMVVRQMLNAFTKVFDPESQRHLDRLSITLPVPPGNDLFERMTFGQMATFQEKLTGLGKSLDDANVDPDPHTASHTLRKVFGDDFPVTEKVAAAKPRTPPIVSSGNSG